jgi:hypothetical protein
MGKKKAEQPAEKIVTLLPKHRSNQQRRTTYSAVECKFENLSPL